MCMYWEIYACIFTMPLAYLELMNFVARIE